MRDNQMKTQSLCKKLKTIKKITVNDKKARSHKGDSEGGRLKTKD